MQQQVNEAYEAWRLDPTPANMGALIRIMNPLLISEINRYPGDNHILRGKAKLLASQAVRNYDPSSGARLTSWVVTQLQPLSRFGRRSNQILNVPEMAYRQFAELDARRKEFLDDEGREPEDQDLADMTGLSIKRINDVRKMNPTITTTGAIDEMEQDDNGLSAPAVEDLEADPMLNTAIEAVYDSSDDRDRTIIDLKMGRKGKPLANQEIAMRLGVSPGLISQRSLTLAKQIEATYGI